MQAFSEWVFFRIRTENRGLRNFHYNWNPKTVAPNLLSRFPAEATGEVCQTEKCLILNPKLLRRALKLPAGLRDASDYFEFNFVARWKRGAGAQTHNRGVASLWCKFSFCCVLTRVYQNPTSLLPLIFCFVLRSLLFNFFSFHFEKFLCLKSDSPQVLPVAAVCSEWKQENNFYIVLVKNFNSVCVANAGIWIKEVFMKWKLPAWMLQSSCAWI